MLRACRVCQVVVREVDADLPIEQPPRSFSRTSLNALTGTVMCPHQSAPTRRAINMWRPSRQVAWSLFGPIQAAAWRDPTVQEVVSHIESIYLCHSLEAQWVDDKLRPS